MPPGSALTFESVRVERGGRRLVDDVTFDVRERTVHALLGHNGAGKTSLLRAVAGLVPTRGGTIRAASTPAVLFVGDRYPPDLTAAQVIDHRSRLVGATETAEVVRSTGVDEFLTTRGAALSTGMAQRLSIATALLSGARVLVLDEPTSGLDPQGVEHLRATLLAIRDRGRTVLVCSHDLAQLELVCDDVTCLRQGRVTSTGPVAEAASGLPSPRQILRTSDDARAAEILDQHAVPTSRSARGVCLPAGASLPAALAALTGQVEVLEATVDRGLFVRLYDRDASAPPRRTTRARRRR
ncbi:ATP-binding cassette domain-containing protein [Sanguibacter keddieii]|nr:ABC transporter ATP-binding protein [Sanguibacter keddieii]